VEVLLENGADPSLKNHLGYDALSYCNAFPEIKASIKRITREVKRVQHNDKNKSLNKSFVPKLSHVLHPKSEPSNSFTLQRRLSTATPVKYEMYLMSLTTMFTLFGDVEDRKMNMNLCHQDLLGQGKLIRYEDLPLGAFVMFISHQWNGFNHPDPNGVQIECMVKTFRRLRDGTIDRVDTDPFHTIVYKTNDVTHRKEWMSLLSNAYVFYDFWSQPQPTLEPENSARREKLEQGLQLAISSIGAYVERADCLVVLVPGAIHVDRISDDTGRREFTCYRTYRKRAFCVMEMIASYLSRRKTHPILLVRSSEGVPQWVSSLESLKLSVGKSNFTCCERNHQNRFEICNKKLIGGVLEKLIDKKVKYLFKQNAVVSARFTFVQKQWYLRSLPSDSISIDEATFRKLLFWNNNVEHHWFDRGGVSILFYGVATCDIKLVKSLLHFVDKTIEDKETRLRYITSAIPQGGFVQIGITGNTSTLHVRILPSPRLYTLTDSQPYTHTACDVSGNSRDCEHAP
jgi:hypothetical protein